MKVSSKKNNCTQRRELQLQRRVFLRQLAGGALLLGVGAAAQGCGLFDEAEKRLCTRAELAEQGFFLGEFNGEEILVQLDEAAQPFVLELVCSHKACTVEYFPARQQFICPCHKGRYDRFGQVLSGKPQHPLRQLKAEWRGEELWVMREGVK